jgi:hypothetical protein
MKNVPCMYILIPGGEFDSPCCSLSFAFPEHCKKCSYYDYLQTPINPESRNAWRLINGNADPP